MADPARTADDLAHLLHVLPAELRDRIASHGALDTLLEIVLDLGRAPEARFAKATFELGTEPLGAGSAVPEGEGAWAMIDVQAAYARLAANGDVIRALASGLAEGQSHWRPTETAWSIVEVINHLRDEEREDFRTRLDLTLRAPSEPWPRIDPERWARERDYNARELAGSLDAFLGERRASLAWLAGLDAPDWGAVHHHPSIGVMSAADVLGAWIAHDHLHIRQLDELHWQWLAGRTAPIALSYAGGW